MYRLLKWCFSSAPNLVLHLFLETSASTLGPEDAAMPLVGEIEEIGLGDKPLLPNAGKSYQKSKKRSHKKVSSWGCIEHSMHATVCLFPEEDSF